MPQVQTYIEVLQYRAAHQGDKLAFGFLEKGETLTQTFSYAELDAQAQVIAAYLQTKCQPGDRAMLVYPSGLDYIAAFFGCLYAGVIAVPIYPPQMGRQQDRIFTILKDSEASICLTTGHILEMIGKGAPELLSNDHIEWLDSTQIPANQGNNWVDPEVSADHLAFLQYTSGSTGTPKGVMVSHRNLIANQQMISTAFQTSEDSVVVGWLPLYHDMGLIGNILNPVYNGGSMYLMTPLAFLQRPMRWLEAVQTYKGTHSGGPNFAYELLVAKSTVEEIAQLDLSCWEKAFCGAEPVRADTLKKFSDRFASAKFNQNALYPCFGMAETTLFVSGKSGQSENIILHVDQTDLAENRISLLSPEHPNAIPMVSNGTKWLDENWAIVDPETCTTKAPLEVGELWVSGPHVAEGYWNKPEVTTETFQAKTSDGAGPFLRTGDLAFIHEGNLYICGRLKDLIIIRGKNHYPQDIEHTVFSSHPALKQGGTAAFSVNMNGQEELIVVQEVERGALKKIPEDEVFQSIRMAVSQAHDLQIRSIVLIKQRSIAKTSSGKIQRKATKQAFLDRSLMIEAQWDGLASSSEVESPASPAEAPQTEVSTATLRAFIVTWLAGKLQIAESDIDAEEPLNAYGVDSMMTAEFEKAVSEFIGVEWPVTDYLMHEPSIHEIAVRGIEFREENQA
ncbi:AMP-binding protein [Pontibacter sp. G13]|uniref:AMP-binding protein n=1 Tax=Pontibacter sp. G13 TaxID=3074898 RepID=UPI002889C0AF|nr:AMP-binding protein [Pontibacter sp. G13]WNJ20710.1 AMP-binding protein [Pontibacter sp. G13]